MQQKSKLRKKYFKIRKENYFEIDKKFFSPLLKLIKKKSELEESFNQDIEELSQETETLVSEIEKWKM